MISSQGKSAVLANGLVVKQTIGQQSVAGNYKGGYTVLQGYQQNIWGKIIADSPIKNTITVTTYPNPFVSEVNFEFSKPLVKEISITIFDLNGRLIFNQNKKVKDGLMTIDLSVLPASVFLVRLNNNEVNYYIKIAKSL
jgi:hypothetical protein